MTKLVKATPNGACLFNALAIGFATEVLSGRLDARRDEPGYQQLLDTFEQHHQNFNFMARRGASRWEAFKNWLGHYSNTQDIELILAPVLFKLYRKQEPNFEGKIEVEAEAWRSGCSASRVGNLPKLLGFNIVVNGEALTTHPNGFQINLRTVAPLQTAHWNVELDDWKVALIDVDPNHRRLDMTWEEAFKPIKPVSAPPVAQQTPPTVMSPAQPAEPAVKVPDINELDANGYTALMRACMFGNLQEVRTLLGKLANASIKASNGNTALHLACINGQPDIVRLLLKHDKSLLDITNQAGQTPMAFLFYEQAGRPKLFPWTSRSDGTKAPEILLAEAAEHDINANPDSRPKLYIEVVRILAAEMMNNQAKDTVQADAPRPKGTPISPTTAVVTPAPVVSMVAAPPAAPAMTPPTKPVVDTNIDKTDHQGTTALMRACTVGNIKEAKDLLRRGANPKIRGGYQGATALHCACLNGKPDTVQILLDHDPDLIDIINSVYLTPLAYLFKEYGGRGFFPWKKATDCQKPLVDLLQEANQFMNAPDADRDTKTYSQTVQVLVQAMINKQVKMVAAAPAATAVVAAAPVISTAAPAAASQPPGTSPAIKQDPKGKEEAGTPVVATTVVTPAQVVTSPAPTVVEPPVTTQPYSTVIIMSPVRPELTAAEQRQAQTEASKTGLTGLSERSQFLRDESKYIENNLAPRTKSKRAVVKTQLATFILEALGKKVDISDPIELRKTPIPIISLKNALPEKLRPLLEGKTTFTLEEAYNFHKDYFRKRDTTSYKTRFLPSAPIGKRDEVIQLLEKTRTRILNQEIPVHMQKLTEYKLGDLSALITVLKDQDNRISMEAICTLRGEGRRETLLQVLRSDRGGFFKSTTSYKAFHKLLSQELSKDEIQSIVDRSDEERSHFHLRNSEYSDETYTPPALK